MTTNRTIKLSIPRAILNTLPQSGHFQFWLTVQYVAYLQSSFVNVASAIKMSSEAPPPFFQQMLDILELAQLLTWAMSREYRHFASVLSDI